MQISLFMSSINHSNKRLYELYLSLYQSGTILVPLVYCDVYEVPIDKTIPIFKLKDVKNNFFTQSILYTSVDEKFIKNINYFHNTYMVDEVSIADVVAKIIDRSKT